MNACEGYLDNRIEDENHLADVCGSFHVVKPGTSWPIAICEGNPAGCICSCKGYHHLGICSHVLCINHQLKKFNLRYQLLPIGQKSKKPPKTSAAARGRLGGRPSKPAPPLTREPTADWDSSDEELAAELEKGARGE